MKWYRLIICLMAISVAIAMDVVEAKELTDQQQKEIKMLREELEFLATKLLRITGEEEYTTSHDGHEMLIFGTCGTATNQGISVDCVSPDSTAEKLGILAGDLITEINQVKFVGLDLEEAYKTYRKILKAFRKDDTVTVSFIQKGKLKKQTRIVESFYSPTYSFYVSAKEKNKGQIKNKATDK